MPALVFVAGPNGSGKSTLASHAFLDEILQSPEDDAPPVRVNPDALVRSLVRQHPRTARSKLEEQAAKEADRLLESGVAAGQSIVRETVLSTRRLLPLVRQAKAKGYRFVLVFVLLRDPELNVARVRARVSQGGHDVPADKVRERWTRSLETLPVFVEHAASVLVFDNSAVADPQTTGAGPVLLIDSSSEGLFVAEEVQVILDDSQAPAPLKQMLTAVLARLEGH